MTTLTGNRLVDRLSPPVRSVILRSAVQIDLPFRTELYRIGERPTHLYFITEGMGSVVVRTGEASTVEALLSGKEGLTGAFFLLGSQTCVGNCYMQVPGHGLQVPLRLLESLFHEVPEFRSRALALIQANLNIAVQMTACARRHEAEARLARWLLMTSDVIESDTMLLTQEVLAEMLATQRTTVAQVSAGLKRAGLIDYVRGKLQILDREGLKRVACECYPIAAKVIGELAA